MVVVVVSLLSFFSAFVILSVMKMQQTYPTVQAPVDLLLLDGAMSKEESHWSPVAFENDRVLIARQFQPHQVRRSSATNLPYSLLLLHPLFLGRRSCLAPLTRVPAQSLVKAGPTSCLPTTATSWPPMRLWRRTAAATLPWPVSAAPTSFTSLRPTHPTSCRPSPTTRCRHRHRHNHIHSHRHRHRHS